MELHSGFFSTGRAVARTYRQSHFHVTFKLDTKKSCGAEGARLCSDPVLSYTLGLLVRGISQRDVGFRVWIRSVLLWSAAQSNSEATNDMKHTLIALSVLATCATASAQSSVTMFGVVDASVTRLSSDSANVTGLASGEQSSSRLGFRGIEDLGGGLKAGFWLEGSLAVDNGGTSYRFDRRSTISLLGGFGEVRLGRDKLASYLNVESFDPFGDIGVGGNGLNNMLGGAAAAEGTVEGSHPKRSSNIIAYITPNMGGLQGQLQYSFGERPSNQPNNDRGNIVSARVSYQASPLEVALGYAQLDAGSAATAVTYKATNIGASYDFGVVKPMVLIATERGAGRGVNAYTLGASAPLGQAGELRFGYTRFNTQNVDDADSSKLALGYFHKLSKRTVVYGMLARVSNDNNATRGFAVSSSSLTAPLIAAGDSATGYSVGVRHTF